MSSPVNNSGVRPLGRAVLVEYYQPERKEGVIYVPPTVQGRDVLIEQRALVIEVGPEAWVEERAPRARPGDRVLIAKFSGHAFKGVKDDRDYRMVNDNDIFALITDEV